MENIFVGLLLEAERQSACILDLSRTASIFGNEDLDVKLPSPAVTARLQYAHHSTVVGVVKWNFQGITKSVILRYVWYCM